jgi:serine protease Do
VTKNRLIGLLVLLNVVLLTLVGLQQSGVKLPYSPLESSAIAATIPPTGTAAHRRTEIVEAANRVSPAIVSVGASQSGYVVNPFSDFFSDYTVYPYTQKIPYLGSGVIISGDGLIVTNYHVVENSSDIFVTLMDGREFKAEVMDADTVLDIALLKAKDAKDLPAAKMGNSDDLMIGEWALALGNPFGNLIGDPHPTLTVGVISAVKRSFRPNSELQRVYQDMIQTDAAINPGNSGGALINASGELVGINTFIMSRSGGAEGIGFAIPINRVKSVVEEILLHGKIRSRIMDFRVQNLNGRLAKKLGATAESGAVISEMSDSGPAKTAGFQIGDVITTVDNRPIKDAQDFMLYVWTKPVGTVVKVNVDRAGKQLQLQYELTEASK